MVEPVEGHLATEATQTLQITPEATACSAAGGVAPSAGESERRRERRRGQSLARRLCGAVCNPGAAPPCAPGLDRWCSVFGLAGNRLVMIRHVDRREDLVAEQRLEELFRCHYAAVAAYVRRRVTGESIDDVVAETFLVAWRRPERVPSDSPLPWLLAVARNVIQTQQRGALRRTALQLRLRELPPTERAVVSSGAEPEGALVTALAALGEKDREALTLIAWEGLRPGEAAAVLGELPSTFRARLARAKRRLRRLLEEQSHRPTAAVAARPVEAKETIP